MPLVAFDKFSTSDSAAPCEHVMDLSFQNLSSKILSGLSAHPTSTNAAVRLSAIISLLISIFPKLVAKANHGKKNK